MMMNARGLPIELLDEEELKHRFKEIDAAIERARQGIENAVTEPRTGKPRVKLHEQHHAVAP